MPRAAEPPKTDVAKQIKIGLRLAALASAMVLLLYWCLREPIRRVLMHHPQFTAGEPVAFLQPISLLGAGNIDGNEWADLVVCLQTTAAPRMMIIPGSRDGLRLDSTLELPEAFLPLDMVVADLDGDGLDDIIATPQGADAQGLIVYWNLDNYSFNRQSVPLALRMVDVVDEDQDGHPDLAGITRNFADVRVHRFENRTAVERPAVDTSVDDRTVRDFAAGHLDRRGMDVALMTNERLRLLRSGGLIPDLTSYFDLPPRFWAGQRLSRQVPSLVFRDLNGDGHPDLAYLDTQLVQLLLGVGGGDFVDCRYPVNTQPADRLVAADFDGDGLMDLLTVAPDGQTFQIAHQE